MAIYIGSITVGDLKVGSSQVYKMTLGEDIVWPTIDNKGLCFTAVDPGATIALTKVGTPSSASIEYSTDAMHWQTYTFNDVVTLASAGDKVYFRATSTNSVAFYGDHGYYRFATTEGKRVGASGSVAYLFKNDGMVTQMPGKLRGLFSGCSSLTTPPSLPFTGLVDECYYAMFQNCSSLSTPPSLPATTLASNCYFAMFSGCSNLTSVPNLPATTLASSCYYQMFKGCSLLTTAPSLPATTLAESCYRAMFQECTSLTSAPSLPATTLATRCYQSMFYGCSNLSSIEVAFDAWGTNNETTSWVQNVAASGTFTCPSTLSQTTGVNNIPVGWTVEWFEEPLCFTSQEAYSTVELNSVGKPSEEIGLQTSRDKSTWTTYNLTYNSDRGRYEGDTIVLTNVGDKVYFRASRENYSILPGEASKYYKFTMSGTIAASGNIQSLLKADCSRTDAPEYVYTHLFDGCRSLTSAPTLPATTLGETCYYMMFNGCSNLTTAPDLPATTLANSCYTAMFSDCTSLTSVKIYYTGFFSKQYFTAWLSGILTTGTLYYNGSDTSGAASYIPNNWTVSTF